MKYGSLVTGRLAGACLLAATLFVAAPVQADDGLVKGRLDAVGQKYEIDKDGDFKITYNFTGENRSQLVFISGSSYDVANGVRVRNIFSAVAKVDEDNVAARAVELLKLNNTYKIGAYEIEGSRLLLSVKVPDNITGQQLVKAAQLVASVADDEEKVLSGARDTF